MKSIMKPGRYGNALLLCIYEKAMDGKIKPEEKTKTNKFELNEQKKSHWYPRGHSIPLYKSCFSSKTNWLLPKKYSFVECRGWLNTAASLLHFCQC
jgi:hypothetical protein